jgi:hypothetical protein
VLRGRILSTTPPPTSMPSESGMTSRSSTSSLSPPRRAVGLDRGAEGDHLVRIDVRERLLPKSSATYARTAGTRVAPPTRMTPSSSSALSPASLSARRQATPVRSRSGAISSSKRARVTVTRFCPGDLGLDRRLRRERVLGLAGLVEHEAHELRRLARLSSKPSAREELVRDRAVHVVAAEGAVAAGRRTWKTPSSSTRTVTSNVPPPRS